MQTHMKLQSEFSREFLKTIFAHLPPLASAAWCGPHPLSTPVEQTLGSLAIFRPWWMEKKTHSVLAILHTITSGTNA